MIWALLGMILLIATPAWAAPPTLPLVLVDTTMPSVVGATTKTVCASACDFTSLNTALNHASVKSAGVAAVVVSVTAGQSFTPVTLPVHTNGWVIVQSSSAASLPVGTRVTTAQAALMPSIVTPDSGTALTAVDGAHHYRFVGIEITVAPSLPTVFTIVRLGGQQNALADFPHHIIFDRCYVHGQTTGNVTQGISLNGQHLAVIDSYVSEAHSVGQDSQAIFSYNGPGPYKIVNNHLEGAGENVMFGGVDSQAAAWIPSDIEIRRNHFTKPLRWRAEDSSYAGIAWTVKNLLEFKSAQRVLVEGNLFEYSWTGGQTGMAILLTPVNQNDTAPWSVVQDITIRSNSIRHAGAGMSITGYGVAGGPTQQTKRVLIQNNLFVDIDRDVWLGVANFLGLGNETADVTVDHNTIFRIGVGASLIGLTGNPSTAFVYQNNLSAHTDYGVIGTGFSTGTSSLNQFCPGAVFDHNVLWGSPGNAGNYPAGNFFPAAQSDVGFTDVAGGNYRLLTGSPYHNAATDGTDIGVDISALNVAMGLVITSIQGNYSINGKVVIQ